MSISLESICLAEKTKGRGTQTNAAGRFEPLTRVGFDDGWDLSEDEAPLRTQVHIDASRTAIARNNSPDIPFDRSVNPYRGCEHGCSYCFARPSHAYLGLSPGLDFESVIYAKPEAPRLLEEELRKPRYVCDVMALGSNTDPYQPLERRMGVTRGVLDVLSRFRHPVGIVTKATLVTRDIDLLAPMAARNLAKVGISVTTLDARLARAMEPRAPTPERRLDAIRRLTEAGIPTAVMVAPIIPGLNDHEIEAILERAKAAGAMSANYVVLRLPLEIKDLFRDWLERAVPGRAKHVISLIRQMRGGKDYDAEWRTRMSGKGVHARFLSQRFARARERLGLGGRGVPLDTSQFTVPPRAGDQLALL